MTSAFQASTWILLLIAASVISASQGFLQSSVIRTSSLPSSFFLSQAEERRQQPSFITSHHAPRTSSSTTLFATKKKKKTSQSPKTANHEKWQPYYESLVQFQSQHGHCRVSFEDNPSLHEWLLQQHKSYELLKLGRKTKLTKKRAVALERIGAIPPELLE